MIKVEPPGGGEISRQVGDSYFASLNRNKRSICLDLRSGDGQAKLAELVADSHALLVNMKPSAIKKLGLTYDSLRRHNEGGIVCVALTGYGLHGGGDDPAFDYVIQAATGGVAAMTGDPDAPPTLPGYSAADNSTGLTAALGLLAQIVSGRGGQVDVSLRDVMLSQLNYRASAYLNDGVEPRRQPFGAHSYYVPAQLFPTAKDIWHCSSPMTGSGSRSPVRPGSTASSRWPSGPRREIRSWRPSRRRCHRSAANWEARLKPLRIPAAAVRTLPQALAETPEMVVASGGYAVGGQPDQGRGLPARVPAGAGGSSLSLVVDDDIAGGVRDGLAGQHITLVHLVVVERVVDPHDHAASVSLAMQVPQLPASQANGGGVSPARRAVSSSVSPGYGRYRRSGAVQQDRHLVGGHGSAVMTLSWGGLILANGEYHSPFWIR